jgi:hypothetical protein
VTRGHAGRVRWEPLAAFLLAAGGAAFIFWWLHGRGPAGTEAGAAGRAFRPDALAGFRPEDTAAVYLLRVRELLDAPALREPDPKMVPRLLVKEPTTRRWLAAADIEPSADVDWALVLVTRRDLIRPLVVLRGRFDPARFRAGPEGLRAVEGGPEGLFECRDPMTGLTTYVAPAGDCLVAGTDRALVEEALAYAASSAPTGEEDPQMRRRVLGELDPEQLVWLSVDVEAFRQGPAFHPRFAETLLRPLVDNAAGVEGGLTAADDLRAEVRFRARDRKGVKKLEEIVRAGCDLAKGAPLLGGIDRDFRPLFELLGSGQVEREGNDVVLRCRLVPGKE